MNKLETLSIQYHFIKKEMKQVKKKFKTLSKKCQYKEESQCLNPDNNSFIECGLMGSMTICKLTVCPYILKGGK